MTHFPQLSGFRGGNGLVRVIGHRGARGIMPENTMEGFRFVQEIGVHALEFDVVLTRDGVPVITHNHHLSNAATRDAKGAWLDGPELKVSRISMSDIETYDVGGLDGTTPYGQRFPDQAFLNNVRIPRLSDLLSHAAEPKHSNLYLLLELKSDPDAKNDIEARQAVVSAVVEAVRAHGMQDRTVLHSFDWNILDECRAQAPEMPTSYLSELPENDDEVGEDSSKSVGPDYAAMTVTLPEAVKASGGQIWCPYLMDVTPDLVTMAHELGLLVLTWTVNEPDDIERMIDAGVDGIVSDYPGRVQRHLRNRGLRWD